jgi:hypothetical protein
VLVQSKLLFALVLILLAGGVDWHLYAGKHRGHPTPTPSPTPPSVTLAWDASLDTVQGYHLWIGFQPGQETLSTDMGNVLVWTVQLSPATTYFFYGDGLQRERGQ